MSTPKNAFFLRVPRQLCDGVPSTQILMYSLIHCGSARGAPRRRTALHTQKNHYFLRCS